MMRALPFPIWNKEFLIGISNTLGCFIVVEKEFHLIFDKRMAKFLVELDVSKGLLAEIGIVCNNLVISQRLDYLNMPFICSVCHETGHLRNSCTSLLHGAPLHKGFLSLEPPSHSPLVVTPPQAPTEDPSPAGLYGSSSPTPYDDLTKGELVYLQDIENVARITHPSFSMLKFHLLS